MPGTGWTVYGVLMSVLVAALLGMLIPRQGGTAGKGSVSDICQPDEIVNESLYISLEGPHDPSMYNHPDPGIPAVNVSYNAQGLREEPFDATPPPDTVRILFLGDSFTYGLGLNVSQRYTDIVERQLNTAFDQPVQVINAGMPGGGIRDYYQILYNRGVLYNPDIVVVGFYRHDSISRRRGERWENEVMQEYNLSDPTRLWSHEPALEAYERNQEGFFRNLTWNASDIRIYGNRMQTLAERHGFKLVFYHLMPIRRPDGSYEFPRIRSDPSRTVLGAWARKCGLRLVQAPPRLRERSRYTFPDGHFNPAGNAVLADTLSPVLRRIIADRMTP